MTESTVEQGATASTYMTATAQRDAPQNPYVGPRTFTFADRNWYFGRTREARDLLALVIAERLTLFYAQSGAGKSSLLHTGIIPALREEARYLVLPVGRVGGELPAGISDVANIYTFNLLLSLDQSEDGDPRRFTAMSLRKFMQGLRTGDGKRYVYDAATAQRAAELQTTSQSTAHNQPPHVLIIDQFEELVTTHPQRWREREAFFEQLGDAMRADPLLWVVLTLREDFIAALDPFAYHVPGSLTNRFYMQRMGVEAALEAVKRPAAQAGRPFAEGVAETLVDNLRRIKVAGQEAAQLGQYIEPVQLQVVCYQLWENLAKHHGDFGRTPERKPQQEITQTDLQQAGDVDTALADFYEDAVRSALQDETVTVSERELRAWFDKQLITEAGTRGTVYYGDRTTATMANRVVDLLQRRFLLRAELRAGGIWVELVHDRFVEPIRAANQAWLQRQSPLLRAAQAWEAAQRSPSLLLSQQQLAALQAEITFESSDPLVAAFVVASEDEVKSIADREAAERRERELVQAQAIAKEADARRRVEALRAQEAEARQRAEVQTASRLRKFVISLAVLGIIALLAAVVAAVFGIRTVQLNQAVQQQATRVAAERDSVLTAEANAQINEDRALAAQGTAEAERQSAVGLSDSLAAVLTAQAPTPTPAAVTVTTIPNGGTDATRVVLIPTPVPTVNIGATATFAAAQAQLVQVQATQTAVAIPALSVIVPDIVVSVNAAPSVNANSIETVRSPTKLPVIDVTDDFWIGVELPDGRQGWVYGYTVFFEGDRSSLPTELRSLVIFNRDDLPFVHGIVTSWSGAAGGYLLADPANEQTEIRWVPVGTNVTLLEEGTGSDGYGSRIWYLVALPDPNGTNQLLKGWLPKEVLGPVESSVQTAALTSVATATQAPTPTEDVAATATFAEAQVQATQAAISVPTGRIVFTSNRASHGDLYAVNVDGSDLQRLTYQIAFEADIFSDSGQILFTTSRDGGASIYIRNTDGTERSLLDAEDNWEPAYDPNTRRLAFVSSRNNRGWEIYTVNLDGSNLTHVTASDPARDPARYWAPDWSPDGRQLVFVGGQEGQEDIWISNADGSNPQRLVDSSGSDVYPAWSPDGQTIVFASNRTGSLDIYTVNIATGRQVNLTNSPTDESYPTWSPDGNWIAFGREDIFIMSKDGSNQRRVDDSNGNDWYPLWIN